MSTILTWLGILPGLLWLAALALAVITVFALILFGALGLCWLDYYLFGAGSYQGVGLEDEEHTA